MRVVGSVVPDGSEFAEQVEQLLWSYVVASRRVSRGAQSSIVRGRYLKFLTNRALWQWSASLIDKAIVDLLGRPNGLRRAARRDSPVDFWG